MSRFLEDNDNIFVQVFAEFSIFLYLTLFDAKVDTMLHNVMFDSKKIHIRTLSAFFSNQGKYPDDLIYTDLLATPRDLHVDVPGNLNTFINKSTAHLSKKRGKISFSDQDFVLISERLIKAIYDFLKELDSGNINDNYKKYWLDQTAIDLKNSLYAKIIKIVLLNDQHGKEIKL